MRDGCVGERASIGGHLTAVEALQVFGLNTVGYLPDLQDAVRLMGWALECRDTGREEEVLALLRDLPIFQHPPATQPPTAHEIERDARLGDVWCGFLANLRIYSPSPLIAQLMRDRGADLMVWLYVRRRLWEQQWLAGQMTVRHGYPWAGHPPHWDNEDLSGLVVMALMPEDISAAADRLEAAWKGYRVGDEVRQTLQTILQGGWADLQVPEDAAHRQMSSLRQGLRQALKTSHRLLVTF